MFKNMGYEELLKMIDITIEELKNNKLQNQV